MTEKNLPTKAEAAAAINIGAPNMARAIIDRLEELGVVFAPKPVAPPEDPENWVARSARGFFYVGHRDGNWEALHDGDIHDWSFLSNPIQLFRKVGTPEPAPVSRAQVREEIAQRLLAFGEQVNGDPIKPDIAAWIAREPDSALTGKGTP